MTFKYAVFRLPRAAIERYNAYSYAKIETKSVIQALFDPGKEMDWLNEESKDQTSTELSTEFFAIGKIIGWKVCQEVWAPLACPVKIDKRYWCANRECNVHRQLVRLSRNVQRLLMCINGTRMAMLTI